MLLCHRVHLRHLIGIGICDTDIASLSRTYSIVHSLHDFLGRDIASLSRTYSLVHSLHDFLGRSLVVPDMVDVQIDIIHAKVL